MYTWGKDCNLGHILRTSTMRHSTHQTSTTYPLVKTNTLTQNLMLLLLKV